MNKLSRAYKLFLLGQRNGNSNKADGASDYLECLMKNQLILLTIK